VLVLILVLLSGALLRTSTLATRNGQENKGRVGAAAANPVHSVSSSASHARPRVVSAPAVDRAALIEAQLGTAALESNAAWIAAMHTARTDDLATIKTGSNLRSVADDIAVLRRSQEHWRISVRSIDVLWARVVGPARGQVLMHKTDESRLLYRHGHVGPLLVAGGSYYSLYVLESAAGRWMISNIIGVSDARGAQLAANPPPRFAPTDTPTPTMAPPRITPTMTPLPLTTVPHSGSPRPTATPTAPVGVVEASADPARAVRAFYGALSARAYATAFGWFTIRLQTQLADEARWADHFKQESPIVVESAAVLTRSPLASTVAVTFTGTWAAANGRQVRLPYAGQWRLLHGPRGWRLDSPDNLHRIEG